MMSSEFGPDFKSIDAHVNHTFLPVFWLEESGQASAVQAEQLKGQVYLCVIREQEGGGGMCVWWFKVHSHHTGVSCSFCVR